MVQSLLIRLRASQDGSSSRPSRFDLEQPGSGQTDFGRDWRLRFLDVPVLAVSSNQGRGVENRADSLESLESGVE